MTLNDSTYTRRFFSLYSQEEKDKVRGHAFYPTDYLSAFLPEGVAWVDVVRSPYAGAHFKKIDKKSALTVEGMLQVITASDIPKNLPYGSRRGGGQFILAEKEVLYRGEPVALLVAESKEALTSGKKKLKIDWEPISVPETQVVDTMEYEKGEPSSQKLTTVCLPFCFPSLQPRYLEAESGWVAWQEGQLTFHIGSLLSEAQRAWLSEVLDIPTTQILAKEFYLGGRFGGRQQRELIAFLALAAHLTKRSVCLHFDQREQDIGSFGYSGELTLGADPHSKKLEELKGRIIVDAGSYPGNARLVLNKVLEHAECFYDFQHIHLQGEIVLTPTHPRRALRGEGLTSITWVTEQLIEKMAREVGESSLDFRRMNVSESFPNAKTIFKELEHLERPFHVVSAERNRPLWEEKTIVGRGFACQGFKPINEKEFDYSEVEISLQHSGSFVIRTSNLTLDLNAKGALCEVAATVLKTHPKAFMVEGKMRQGFDRPARRETYPEFYYLAQSTWNAAFLLKKKLLEAGSKIFQSKNVILKDGAVVNVERNRKMGYRELTFTHGIQDFSTSFLLEEVEKPWGASAGALSRVSFHPLTGEVRVESVHVVLDAGPVLYRKGLETELETAVSWAMAALFSSEASKQPIPTPLDGPESVTLTTVDYPVKDYSEQAPDYFGAKGVADVLMSVVLASFVNAIFDAKETMLEAIPMSLEFMYPKRKPVTNVHPFPRR